MHILPHFNQFMRNLRIWANTLSHSVYRVVLCALPHLRVQHAPSPLRVTTFQPCTVKHMNWISCNISMFLVFQFLNTPLQATKLKPSRTAQYSAVKRQQQIQQNSNKNCFGICCHNLLQLLLRHVAVSQSTPFHQLPPPQIWITTIVLLLRAVAPKFMQYFLCLYAIYCIVVVVFL